MLIFNPYYSGWPLLSIKLALRSSKMKEEIQNRTLTNIDFKMKLSSILYTVRCIGWDPICEIRVVHRSSCQPGPPLNFHGRSFIYESAGFPRAISRTIGERDTLYVAAQDMTPEGGINKKLLLYVCIIHWVGTWEFAH